MRDGRGACGLEALQRGVCSPVARGWAGRRAVDALERCIVTSRGAGGGGRVGPNRSVTGRDEKVVRTYRGRGGGRVTPHGGVIRTRTAR